MGSLADYAENAVLDHIFGAVTFTPPATLYFGLSTSTISDAGGNITEPSGNNYARKGVTNNATNFPSASGGSKSNGAAIQFNTPSGSWGTVTYFFIADAPTGGNIIAWSALTDPQTISSGNIVKIDIGGLTLTLD